MTDAQFLEFNQNWMNVVFPHLVDGGLLGTFIDWRACRWLTLPQRLWG